MKNSVKVYRMVTSILALVQVYDQQSDSRSVKHTVVHAGDLQRQAAILEKDYPKIAARFSKDFPGAVSQLWLKEGSSLFVYFLHAGNKTTAVFSANGRLQYALSVIGFFELPQHVRNKLKDAYSVYSFSSAKLIQASGYTAYEIVLENSDGYILLSTTDADELEVMNTIRKTPTLTHK